MIHRQQILLLCLVYIVLFFICTSIKIVHNVIKEKAPPVGALLCLFFLRPLLEIYIVLVHEYMAIYRIEVHMKDLVQFLTEVDDELVLEKRLKVLLTPNEISEMVSRLKIIALLDEGVPQRDIAKQLGVGIATVTRGSRALKELKEI
jgi:TrpR family trp operon transcriptional repressor